jgi:hypothetical protein
MKTSLLLLVAALVVAPSLRADTPPPSPAAIVDINTATQAELEAVKGIAAVTAQKIIAGRPYTAVDDLKNAGVSAATLAQIRPYLTVTAPPPALAGGGPPPQKLVWVNLDTKVFHRASDPWFGKTKHGVMMGEAEALQAGYHEAKPGAVPPKKN